jgi:polysaccharide biosynthesis protein PslH
MARQLQFLKQLGYTTTFAAVASHYDGGFDETQWQQFLKFAPELGADEVIVSRYPPLGMGRRVWEAGKALTQRQNAMHWALAPAHFTMPPPELMKVLTRSDLRLLLANHVYTLPFAFRLRRSAAHIPLVTVTHDVQTHILLDRNAKAPWTRQIEPEATLLQTEIEWLAKSDSLIHVSGEDYTFFKEKLPHQRHAIILPSFDRLARPRLARTDGFILHVAGAHPGNRASLAWYFREVAPLLRQPARHVIVGQVCAYASEFLPDGVPDWVDIAGETSDLESYYAGASCAICPTTRGRGISIKTIEAFAAGLPVIGTPLAFRGMPQDALAAAGITPVSDAQKFADLVVAAGSADFQRKQRAASEAMFEGYFSNAAGFRAFSEALAQRP